MNETIKFIKSNFDITYKKKPKIKIPADVFCAIIGEKDNEDTEQILNNYLASLDRTC